MPYSAHDLTPLQVAYSTVALTVFTLVFGELIPKSLGVSNAELVARTMVSRPGHFRTCTLAPLTNADP